VLYVQVPFGYYHPMKIARLFLLATAAVFAADVDGKWNATVTTGNGEFQLTYTLKADGEKLSGTISSQLGELEVKEGKVAGNDLSWVMIMERNGNQMRILHKATVNGAEMKIKAIPEGAGDRTMEFTAKKAAS